MAYILFIYCFFGWILNPPMFLRKTGHFVNCGFLRLPASLYGTGAVMMLWVSLPVKDNLVSGVPGRRYRRHHSEYVTGWGMEKLFKMKYWDYSNQRFNEGVYLPPAPPLPGVS